VLTFRGFEIVGKQLIGLEELFTSKELFNWQDVITLQVEYSRELPICFPRRKSAMKTISDHYKVESCSMSVDEIMA